MKILFLTIKQEDYLADSLLHGLRHIHGNNVVDYPQKECLYLDYSLSSEHIYGNGFTIYKTLENIHIDRDTIAEKIKNNYFNLVIFTDFSKQFGLFLKFRNYLTGQNTVILDGSDSSKLFLFHGRFWRKFPLQFLHISFINFLTFKREWTPITLKYRSFFPLATLLSFFLYKKISLRKISFSIPADKICDEKVIKRKLFPVHIVDKEIVDNLKYSSTRYVFKDEKEYYHDLQVSKFGITTKRAGWDCMRHYEIAANGTVMCFRDLTSKYEMCAPHDLVPGINCLSYASYEDLMQQINQLTDTQYDQLRLNSMDWVKHKTTKIVANDFLNVFSKYAADN
jgi:hypothetical protein